MLLLQKVTLAFYDINNYFNLSILSIVEGYFSFPNLSKRGLHFHSYEWYIVKLLLGVSEKALTFCFIIYKFIYFKNINPFPNISF